MSKSISLLDRYRGCMVGAVIGDCLGSPVECKFWRGIPAKRVSEIFKEYQNEDHKILKYTDDTAMARQVADSIISMRSADSKDMAQRFVQEFDMEPFRGYGASVGEVFRKLKRSKCQDPYKPASEQFNGSGSYGNGAAMRVHPIGLLSHNASNTSIIENVKKSAKVTHTHMDAINGAVLQAACVSWALQGSKTSDMRKKIHDICSNFDKPDDTESETYIDKVDIINECLEDTDVNITNLIEDLGNDVAALGSVPASVYSFLAGSTQNTTLPSKDVVLPSDDSGPGFERCLQLAMMFGGDADTIMSMTGAIAGAYFVESGIPDYMKRISEGVDNAMRQADQLHKLVTQ